MRLRYGSERVLQAAWPGPCRDCGALDGQHHIRGCCLQECPACGSQAMLGCGERCSGLLYPLRALRWRWRLARGATGEHAVAGSPDGDDD
jgi:hypothetical protein